MKTTTANLTAEERLMRMASLATQYCVVKIDELSYLFCDNAVIVKCQHVIPCSLIEPEFASSVMGRWRSLMFTPGYEIADVGFMCRILGVAYPRVCREIGVAVIDERYFRLFPSAVLQIRRSSLSWADR